MSGSDDALFVIQQHFIDSLSCLLSGAIHPQNRLLDIGTGAGFPAIPLKIYYPELQVVTVDAVTKKVMFLRHLCRQLNFQQIECMAIRLGDPSSETLPSPLAAPFDSITARAVGSLSQLLELAAPLLAPEGTILLQRGKDAEQELKDEESQIEHTGMRLEECRPIPLSFLDHPRYLLLFRHQKTT